MNTELLRDAAREGIKSGIVIGGVMSGIVTAGHLTGYDFVTPTDIILTALSWTAIGSIGGTATYYTLTSVFRPGSDEVFPDG